MPEVAFETVDYAVENPFEIRNENFPNEIAFYGPGLKPHITSEFSGSLKEFVSISVTGNNCALNCEHCNTKMLDNMLDLPSFDGSLFDMAKNLHEKGAKGILVSGGSNIRNQVPLLPHMDDMKRIRKELEMVVRVHPGLPDEETCAALSELDVDGVMLDIISDQETITNVYHLDATPSDYEEVLERLNRYEIPAIPHIVLGHYFGKMNGEWAALDMIEKYPPKTLVLVILLPLTGTGMEGVVPPSVDEIGEFFETARLALPATPILLGCTRPLGPMKIKIDQMAINAGLNGIAFPSEGIVAYASEKGLNPSFVNACCGVTW
ncbi:MAG: radical SAM protein [Candidatus Marinimicrobia bacterium]|nr:radical SAM protein [Candidatus Neomarinimicrobiota bacterium]